MLMGINISNYVHNKNNADQINSLTNSHGPRVTRFKEYPVIKAIRLFYVVGIMGKKKGDELLFAAHVHSKETSKDIEDERHSSNDRFY